VTRIFISYRRDDAAGSAGRLYDRLQDEFGPGNVFIDVDTLQPGDDFVEAIKEKLSVCDVMLVVVGKQWLTATDDAGRPRLHDEGDYARIELQTALDRGVITIPVLVERATMPRPQDLPEPLRPFARRQAAELRDTRWRGDVDHLLERLKRRPLKTAAEDIALFWPDSAPPLPIWSIADHREARSAFERLITRDAPWRYLPLRGSSETGKSHITRQMLLGGIQIAGLACGRFDFKATTDVDAELRAFVQDLDVPLPTPGVRFNERLSQIIDALKHRGKPALLIFDTYEKVGDAQDWMEKQLLLGLMRNTWLRVVIAGQQVPNPVGAVWATIARAPLELVPPAPEEWLEFGQRCHKSDITVDLVRKVHELCNGRPALLAQLFGPRS
jgi:hypothetical protein